MRVYPPPPITFPPAWHWFVDELLPSYVKKHYSPKEAWKEKPFGETDARFFFRGIEELSELFTDERSGHVPPYFKHPRFRSSYLLYFIPLQAAKFITLFQLHAKAMAAALSHARISGKLKIVDLGAGPATASLAFLIWFLNQPETEGISLEWDGFDTEAGILKDGKQLIELVASQFPKLRNKIQARTHTVSWWDAPGILNGENSLILMGNVLNEMPQNPRAEENQFHGFKKLFTKMNGGGCLIVEPASRSSSQLLSQLRNSFFEHSLLPASPTSLWGPCLHAEKCPLSFGKDWCHFSVPVDIPGKWFKKFSKALSSERQWVKFSYVWIASKDYPAPLTANTSRRVISDPLSVGKKNKIVLLCEPEQPKRLEIPVQIQIRRGDLLSGDHPTSQENFRR